jgi:hypothetical protein
MVVGVSVEVSGVIDQTCGVGMGFAREIPALVSKTLQINTIQV